MSSMNVTIAQSIMNGGFESNTAGGTSRYNLNNISFNYYMSDVTSFGGSSAEGDIIHTSSSYGNPRSGSYCLGMVGGPNEDSIALHLSCPLTSGNSYTLTFYVYRSTSFSSIVDTSYIGVSTSNTTFGTQVGVVVPASTTASWQQRTITFTAPNNGQYITICGKTSGVNSWRWFDDFSLSVASPLPLPTITAHPSNTSVLTSGNTTLSATAINGYAYQWQVSTGGSYSNISNSGVYSNATTSTLSITGATSGMNGNSYRCVAIGCSGNATSTPATLTVSAAPAPSITSHPSSDTVCHGGASYFVVSANDATSYQWQVNTGSGWSNLSNGGVYGGATTDSLYITSATVSMNGYQYRCIATGAASPAATSNAATLNVVGVTATTNDTVCAGENAVLTATASAATSLIRWYTASTGGTLVDTGNNLTLTAPASTATYYAQAVGTSGSGTTNDSLVTPYNTNNGQRGAMFDVQTGGSPITVTHFSANIYTGTTADYEIYYKTGTHVGFETNSSAWTYLGGATSVTSLGMNVPTPLPITFSVTIPANTRYSFYVTNTSGGGLHYTDGTAVGNYLAGNSDVTIYEGVGKSYPFGLTLTPREVNATMFYTKGGGECTSSVRIGATVTVNPQATVTANPTNSAITSGNNTSFSVTATNANSYQWQVNTGSGWGNVSNGGVYSGATTATLSLTAPNNTYSTNQYRCIVTNSSNCADTSSSATLSVTGTAPSINSQPSNSIICEGNNATFSVSASGTSLTYQWQVNTGSGWSNLSNTGIYSGVTGSTMLLSNVTNAYNNYQYRCVVTGSVSPAATSTAATLTIGSAPSVTVQPTNSTVGVGSATSFSVTATGSGLTYQWQVNSGSGWSNIFNIGVYSGATTNTLSLSTTTAGLSGNQYRCVVSGTCTPNATSNAATLTVNSAPAITAQPANSTICSGSNTTFSVTATSATSYQWQLNTGSGWTNVSNGGIYSGATTSTLTLTSATTTQNGYQYRCEVSGAAPPNAVSNAATLTVNSAPSVTVQPTNSTVGAGSATSFSVTATGTAITYQWQVNSGSGWANVTNGGIYSGATTNTLSLSTTTAGLSGNQYRCVVSGTCTPNATSNAATLTVNSAPAITAQPANNTICSGSNTTFSITATSATSYQWQLNTGSGWTNVTNGGIYSGATTNTLTLTNATTAQNSYQYRCEVSGAAPPNAVSNAATLTVNEAPSVTTQPSGSTICENANTTFSVVATGAGLTYQWQVNTGSGWASISNTGIYTGATTATLTLTAATTTQNGYQYRCVVSGTCSPSANSNAATLTINEAPSITLQPSNNTICSGANTSYSTTATGTGLTYQWQVNSGSGWTNVTNTGIYSNATTSTLTLTGATAIQDGYQYRCIVSGTCTPAATTTAATLTIQEAPAISTQPSNTNVCSGGNASFNLIATGAGLTYQWQVNNGSGWANLTNGGIYSGVTTSVLSLTGATTVNVSGYQYRCIISGTCSPNATSATATLSINSILSISAQPANATVCDGNNTTFSVTASGSGLTYQWQVNTGSGWSNLTNGGIYSNVTTSSLALTGATTTQDGYQYRCVINSTCTSPANSNAGTLTVNPAPSITTQPNNSTICNGQNTTFSVTASGVGLTYQWEVNTGSGWTNVTNSGIYSGATTTTLNLTAATTTQNGYQYRCVVGSTCTPGATTNAALLTIQTSPVVTTQPANSTICDGNNTTFSVAASGAGLTYQWEVNTGSGWSNLANTGIYSNVTTNTLTLTGATATEDGYQYRAVVSGTCTPAVTSNAATLNINSLLTINSHPANSTICSGNNTTFSVLASASGLTYQWQVNSGSGWSNITNTGIYSGATTATLALTGATMTQNGYQYRCVLNSTCTAPVNSNTATLTINAAPVITIQPTNSTICEGGNATFGIAATGAGLTYQWEVYDGSSWSSVTNSGIYSGATTNSLSLTSASFAVNGYQYRCIVGGACVPGVTSSTVDLTVNTAPVITTQPVNSTICSGNNTNFNVVATGSNLTYQWQVNNGSGWSNVNNGGVYTGAVTSTLNLNSATTAIDGYQYRCVISGTCLPGATSSIVSITVNTAPSITTQPNNSTICENTNTSYTIVATGTGLTYQWQVDNGSGWSNVANAGIYSGATTNTLNLTSATTTVDGYQYRCVVSGACIPGVNSNAATLTINTAPIITTQPVNSVICDGNNTTFNVAATGTGLTYQWQVNSGSGWTNLTNTGIYSNATTSTLNLIAATTAVDGYQYRCVVSGTCTPSTTSVVTNITVNALPSISGQPVNRTICEGTNTTFNVTATGTALTYQWQVNSGSGWNNITNTGIYSGATTATLNLTAATTAVNSYQYRCIVGGTCTPPVISTAVSITIQTSPVVSSSPTNKTICEGLNHSFNVTATGTGLTYQWQMNNGSGWTNITNGGVYAGATSNTLSLTNIPPSYNGYQYRCIVSGTCSPSATSGAATLTVNANPVVTSQPAGSITICSGDNTSFSIAATGTGLAYQWWMYNGSTWSAMTNGGVYSGVTSNTLSITGPTASSSAISYRYYCVVSGTCATANSDTSLLTIQARPAITSNPAATSVCDSTDNVTFAVSATGTALTYQWQVSNGSTWSNINNTALYSGITTNQLTINKAYYYMNGYDYRCVISGACTPSVITTGAKLTVYPLKTPIVQIQASNDDICVGTPVTFTTSATNEGSSPSYVWKVNGSTVASGSTYTSSTFADMDTIVCEMTSSYVCPRPATVVSNKVGMKVTPYSTPTVNISSPTGNQACLGRPYYVYAQTTNGGSTPVFQWQVNGNPVGSNIDSFTSTMLQNGDIVNCKMTSSIKCPSPETVTSNDIVMDVIKVIKANITIVGGPDTQICKDVEVTLYTWFTNGGPTPKYQWIRNGKDMPGETNATLKSSALNDQDVIECRFISSARCVFPEVSNSISFDVGTLQPTAVNITVYHIGDDTYVFKALPVNGGQNPKFRWFAHGKVVQGETGDTYIAKGIESWRRVQVEMVSSLPCVTDRVVMSKNITTAVSTVTEEVENIDLYPNPNNGKFNITVSLSTAITDNVQLEVMNSLGQIVYRGSATATNKTLAHTIDLEGRYAAGTYMLRMTINDKKYNKRFVIAE